MRGRTIEIALGMLLLAVPAFAADMQVSDAWIRSLPANLPAAGYFTLRNDGKATVELTGAASAACGMAMLHRSTATGMEDVSSVAVAPGATVKFAPGGYHLMCMNPTGAIKPGAKVSVTLSFSDGSKVTGDFAVRNAKGE